MKQGIILLLASLGAILSYFFADTAWVFAGILTGNMGAQGAIRNNWGSTLIWFRILPPLVGAALGVGIGRFLVRKPTNNGENGLNPHQDNEPSSDDWSA